MKTQAPKFIYLLLMASLLAPFPYVSLAGVSINLYAWINLLLAFVIVGYFSLYTNPIKVNILFLVAVFIFYYMIGLYHHASFIDAAYHTFTFLPFISAFVLLELDIGLNFEKVMFSFTVSAAISAISASLIYFYFPATFAGMIRDNKPLDLIAWGRVLWQGYTIVLVLATQLTYLNCYSPNRKNIIRLSLLFCILGLLLTFSRTSIFVVMFYLLFVVLCNLRELRLPALVFWILMIVLGIKLVGYITTIHPNVSNMITSRIVDVFHGTADFTEHWAVRNDLWHGYMQRLMDSHFLGQGLGVPMAFNPEPYAYADVSIISFLLPLGIIGSILFFVFIYDICRKIRTIRVQDKTKISFYVIIALSLIISINDDIWSHKMFPLYLVFIINSLKQSHLKKDITRQFTVFEP